MSKHKSDKPELVVERVIEPLKQSDLNDLCDATLQAIAAGGGFGWVSTPQREVLERFWKGVMMIPERTLFVGRVDGAIGGSAQMFRPARNNEAQAHAAQITTTFVAPWARNRGMGARLIEAVQDYAWTEGFKMLNLDVRETQDNAHALFEKMGFVCWGHHPFYALVQGNPVPGRYYYKHLTTPNALEKPT